MGTRINTNTLAQNAARYGQLNDAKVASSIEKLSSGLRINRAADDAAGLVISEGLRAQISGIDQAIKNSNEAANMVKTAEGALSEVHDLLRSMRSLAVHAANTGSNDATAIAADQQQISNAIKSLDRISDTTSFGSLKLLDGTASTNVTSNNSKLTATATGGTVRGAYGIAVTTDGVKGKEISATALTSDTWTASAAVTGSFTALSAGATLTIDDANATMGINDTVVVDLAGAASLQDVVDKINNDSTASKYVKASVDSSNQLVLASTSATGTVGDFDITFAGGAATAVGFAGGGVESSVAADTTKQVTSDVQYTFSAMGRDGNFGTPKTFAIAKGTTLEDVFKNFEQFAKENGIEASMSLSSAGEVTITNNDVGTNRGVQVAVVGSDDALNIDGLDTSDTAIDGAAGGATAVDMVVTVNGNTIASSDIDGSKVSISAASGPNLKDAQGLEFTAADASSTSNGSLTVGGGSLKFQIGANAGEQTEIQIQSTSTNQLGRDAVAGKTLADIDVTSAQGAADAIKLIDKAISDVSKMRADLGAFQSQVLESNVRSLGVAKENLTASESTIRDTDMAAEMVQFTKNNILTQASQAMLSQANNSSQGILQLLRG
jgi:flagellin